MARRSMADSEIPVNWRGQAVLYLQNEVGLRRDKTRKSIECPILSVPILENNLSDRLLFYL
jgi:hypothetical protein